MKEYATIPAPRYSAYLTFPIGPPRGLFSLRQYISKTFNTALATFVPNESAPGKFASGGGRGFPFLPIAS